MRLMLTVATGALLLAAQTSFADLSVTVTGVTDYDFRGISQTGGDAAAQLGVDYSLDHFYAGIWASNVDFQGEQTYPDGSTATVRADGNAELDLLAGFSGEFDGGWNWDVGLTYYTYPGSSADQGVPSNPDDDILQTENYLEVYAGGGYAFGEVATVDAKYWYSPDLYNLGDTASYFETNASVNLPWELALNLHAGYSFGDYFNTLSDDAQANGFSDDADYIDYGIGIARSFGHFDFELKYVGTDTDKYFQVDSGILRNDERVILSVATTLPWSKDGE